MTEDYSNREIDRMFGEIMTLLNDIKEQTTKTNGRVTRLELWKESIMSKVAGVVGSITVTWVLFKELVLK